jgi:hypothetical protein
MNRDAELHALVKGAAMSLRLMQDFNPAPQVANKTFSQFVSNTKHCIKSPQKGYFGLRSETLIRPVSTRAQYDLF